MIYLRVSSNQFFFFSVVPFRFVFFFFSFGKIGFDRLPSYFLEVLQYCLSFARDDFSESNQRGVVVNVFEISRSQGLPCGDCGELENCIQSVVEV